ncbi:MAG TPA: hypothetical protein VHZ28_14915 [Terracidiphilus sp.]|nr:hypothetical protein [Terracidiphilus sp.]
MILRPVRLVFLIVALAFIHTVVAPAQAPIDPSLPEAPLPHKRALFLFPGYDVVSQTSKPIPPLSTRQKYELAFRSTVDPSILIRAEVTTMFDHAVGVGPFYGPGGKGYAQLYGYNVANLASTFVFSDGVIPSLAHQDPRYFRKGSGPVKSRIWWALRSEFVAFGDDGRPMPNYGNMVGLATSAVLSDAYLPERNISVKNTFQAYGIKIATTWAFNILHEYGGVTRIKKLIQQKTGNDSTTPDSSKP